MQEETQLNNPEQVQPVEKKSMDKKDYLAPALVFIALFFSFFVLITMQRLSRKAIGLDDQYGTSQAPVERVTNTMPSGQTAPSGAPDSTKTIEEDKTKDSETVGDDLLNDIDTTTSTDVNTKYNANDLNDLNQ